MKSIIAQGYRCHGNTTNQGWRCALLHDDYFRNRADPALTKPIRSFARGDMHLLIRCLSASAFALAFAPHTAAQAWPAKPIRMIVNAAAGGSTDVTARSMAS